MAWTPIAAFVPQWVDSNGDPYSGAVLKAYQVGTTTNINFATDDTGGTQVTDIVLNASGYPAVSGSIIVPHLNESAKIALYATQAAADADTGAIWSVDTLGGMVLAATLASTASTSVGAGMIGNAIQLISTLASAKTLTGTTDRDIFVRGRTATNDGYEGQFYWDASDLSTEVTADTQNALYIPPNSDTTGASGAWVRIREAGYLYAPWFDFLPGNTAAANYTAWSAISTYTKSDDDTVHRVVLEPGQKYTMTGDPSGFFVGTIKLIIDGGESVITNTFADDDFFLYRKQIFTDGTNSVGFAGYKINAAAPGDITVTCSSASEAGNFTVDRWALVHGYEQQGGAEVPPNLRYFEYLKVRAVDSGTGVVTFYDPVKYNYSTSWRDVENTNPTPSEFYGLPRIIPLYRDEFKIMEYLEINNLTIGGGSKPLSNNYAFSPSGTLYFKANNFHIERGAINFSQVAWSECNNCHWNGPYDPTAPTNNNDNSITIDKICETITLNDCSCPRGMRDGSGVHQFTMNGGVLGENEDQSINLGAARNSQFNNVTYILRSDKPNIFDTAAFFIESMQVNGGRIIAPSITGANKLHMTSDGALSFTPFDAPSNTQLRFDPATGNNGLFDSRVGIGSYMFDITGGDWLLVESITWDGTYYVVDVKPSAASISGTNGWQCHYRNGLVIRDVGIEGGDIGMLLSNRSIVELAPLGRYDGRVKYQFNSAQVDFTAATATLFADGMYLLEVRCTVATAYTGSSTVAKLHIASAASNGALVVDLLTVGTRYANVSASSLLGADATTASFFGLSDHLFYWSFEEDGGTATALTGTWDQMPVFDVELVWMKPPVLSGA